MSANRAPALISTSIQVSLQIPCNGFSAKFIQHRGQSADSWDSATGRMCQVAKRSIYGIDRRPGFNDDVYRGKESYGVVLKAATELRSFDVPCWQGVNKAAQQISYRVHSEDDHIDELES